MRFLALCLLLAGCAEWAPTQKAILRRQAEARFQSCVYGICGSYAACARESAEWCKHLHQDGSICQDRSLCAKAHMEAGCGTDGMMANPPPTCRPK